MHIRFPKLPVSRRRAAALAWAERCRNDPTLRDRRRTPRGRVTPIGWAALIVLTIAVVAMTTRMVFGPSL